MECLDPNKLNAFAEALLTAEERIEVERHLDSCEHCRLALSALVRQGVRSKETLRSRSEPGHATGVEPRFPVASADAMSSDPTHLIGGRFQIERFAGAGGMGTVFRACDCETGRPVALKLINTMGGDADRFEREAEVLSRLEHPGIVRHIAHGRAADGRPFLAMDWLEGEDLATRLSRGPLGLRESLSVTSRMARALAYAHERGVVHRDVKPNNVFLPGGAVENATLVDFGIARLVDATRPMTRTGSVLGTLGYMAPEQARGDKDVDARADVFALGCVLFECLVGRPAFQGQHAIAILAKILLEDPPRVGEIVADTPLWVSDLVQSMLAKKPESRLRSCAEFLAELDRHTAARSPAPRKVDAAAPALSRGEQRLVSVIIVASPRSESAEADATVSAEEERVETDELRGLIAPFGSRLEVLADGSSIVMMEGRGSATDQARNAARCALALHASRPKCTVSLTTGRAILEGRLPLGEAIDRAATLQRTHGRSERESDERLVVIDDTTAGLLDAAFAVRSRGGGLELLGERASHEVVRTLLGKPTPCVGREKELGLMAGVFDECLAEPGARVVLVTAPAGMGKSRLRYEFLRRPQVVQAGLGIFIGRGESITTSAPFTILGGALRANAGILEAEPLESRRRKLRARVARNVAPRDVVRVSEFLGHMIGVHTAEPESAELLAARTDPDRMLTGLRQAWLEFMRAEADANPVLLVIEDLHWAQQGTVDLIDASLDGARDRPFMVLALARPEVHAQHPNLWNRHAITEIELPSLSRKAAEKLVKQTLGGEVSPDTLDRLVDRSAGNPLHLEELIRAVAEGRADELPGSVLAMIQSWVEGLAPDARQVLRAASIFGEVFWKSGVERLVGGSAPGIVEGALAELVRREVVTPRVSDKFQPEAEYVFRHDLVREASYQLLTEGDRRLGHALAAEWLEAAGETNSMVIAEHFARCGDAARINAWLRRWGERVHMLRVAPLLAEVTQHVLPRIDEAGTVEDRVEARTRIASMFGASHDLAAGFAFSRDAQGLCGRNGPTQGILLANAVLHMRHGDFSSARTAFDSIADPSSFDGLDAYVFELGQAQVFGAMGEQAAALGHLDAAALLAPSGDHFWQVELLKLRGLIAYFAGDFARSVEACEQHAELARKAGLDFELALATHNLADSLIWNGELARAERAMSESAEIAERNQYQRLLVHDQMYLAYLRAGGRVDAAIADLRACIAKAESNDHTWDALNGRFWCAKLLAAKRDPDARAELAGVMERAARMKNHLIEQAALKMLEELGNPCSAGHENPPTSG